LTRVILIFVDGLGLGLKDPDQNPCARNGIELLAHYQGGSNPKPILENGFCIPTDATLGINGLPQSATGQSTLFTGVNCSKLVGKHLSGYPNSTLREILKEKSILKQIKDMGLRSAFINAYRPLFFTLNESLQWRLSATTVATLAAGLSFFQIEDIGRFQSLYHDFTNTILIARKFEVPHFTPEEAGKILADISGNYDFILYEYFLTDRAGHGQKMETAYQIIKNLEIFISTLLKTIDRKKTLIILTSDHGNVEDLSLKTHTRNPVMTLLWGHLAEKIINSIHSLEDITPAILTVLSNHL
jgi:2,3-bisphosphoglycerate-independent phosphoglycerate mutase